ncbi:multicopper oxidase family protein [Alsobacter sp. SYSU M60028]|uniref:Multicopper oxidase family protein n=1 Tax=Alsobacter ponti TaxID=2962936 RepID=A0ABT1LAI3_9HYPH|nr:multicopper oxidase family protein [Alsobacter ponti]MCP8938500.1 multicopper oxidase family protein [Alsobacter ponti]
MGRKRRQDDGAAARPDRRALLAGSAAVGLAAALPSARAQSVAPKATAQAGPSDGVPTVHLAAQPSMMAFRPGMETEILAFGRRAPGPELRITRGEALKARLVNNTGKPLSLHWHGVRIDNAFDGVSGLTQEAVAPSGTQDLRFTPPDAGTFIYRPMTLGLAGEQTDHGLAGVVVVDDPSAPPVDLDTVIAVDDWRLSDDGRQEPFGEPRERAFAGRLGNLVTVNGAPVPATVSGPPGGRIRLRFASLCNARLMRIRFQGPRAYVVAVDGQPTDTFEPLRSTLPFAPGARYEIIVELPAQPGPAGGVDALIGDGVRLVNLVAEGPPARNRRAAFPPLSPLAENRLLPAAIPLQKAHRADLLVEGGARPGPTGLEYHGDPQRIWTVNGVSGPVLGERFGKPLFSVKRGTPVVMTLINRTAFAQVLHLHGHCARILHPYDDGWEPYWLDSVTAPEGQTVRFAFVADNKGRWLVGSGILERLDTGLSAWFEVT